jgi:hypothetical protein
MEINIENIKKSNFFKFYPYKEDEFDTQITGASYIYGISPGDDNPLQIISFNGNSICFDIASAVVYYDSTEAELRQYLSLINSKKLVMLIFKNMP